MQSPIDLPCEIRFLRSQQWRLGPLPQSLNQRPNPRQLSHRSTMRQTPTPRTDSRAATSQSFLTNNTTSSCQNLENMSARWRTLKWGNSAKKWSTRQTSTLGTISGKRSAKPEMTSWDKFLSGRNVMLWSKRTNVICKISCSARSSRAWLRQLRNGTNSSTNRTTTWIAPTRH